MIEPTVGRLIAGSVYLFAGLLVLHFAWKHRSWSLVGLSLPPFYGAAVYYWLAWEGEYGDIFRVLGWFQVAQIMLGLYLIILIAGVWGRDR